MNKTFVLTRSHGGTRLDLLVKDAEEARKSGGTVYVAQCRCCPSHETAQDTQEFLGLEWSGEVFSEARKQISELKGDTALWVIAKLGIGDVCRSIDHDDIRHVENGHAVPFDKTEKLVPVWYSRLSSAG